MNRFLSKLYVVFGIFLLSFNTTGFCTRAAVNISPPAEKTKTQINIAIYAPFSNDSAFIGRNMLGALELARDQLKSSDINYSFFTLDKLPKDAKAEQILQKFIDAHHINVFLTEGAESGQVVAPLAKKNKLIHFCFAEQAKIADGKNNFLAQSPNHKQSAMLTKTANPEFIDQFRKEYSSHPITEAGYAYDVFHILHQSAVMAMKTHAEFSSQAIANHFLALESGRGVIGRFNLDKSGIFYKKKTLTA